MESSGFENRHIQDSKQNLCLDIKKFKQGPMCVYSKLWPCLVVVYILLLCYPSATRPETLPKLEQLRPVLEHMQTAMKDQKELQYSLIRCAGLFYGAASAEHQRTADAVVEKERAKLLFSPAKGLAEELKGFGKNLHVIAIQLQFKFDGNENNEKSEKESTLDVNLRINDFNLMYTYRMFSNLKSDGTIVKNDKLLGEDTEACVGMHQQIIGDEH